MKRRGFHLLEIDDQFAIVCTSDFGMVWPALRLALDEESMNSTPQEKVLAAQQAPAAHIRSCARCQTRVDACDEGRRLGDLGISLLVAAAEAAGQDPEKVLAHLLWIRDQEIMKSVG